MHPSTYSAIAHLHAVIAINGCVHLHQLVLQAGDYLYSDALHALQFSVVHCPLQNRVQIFVCMMVVCSVVQWS